MKNIQTIAFDADDTLWVNETNFQETEAQFCELLSAYLPKEEVSKKFFKTEMNNLELYGFGAKSFILSMIETLISITKGSENSNLVQEVINLGKELIQKPVELLDGVKEVLEKLKRDYKLVLATKGDLLDQERKLRLSGLEQYFHHIEIMSNKQTTDYSKLLTNIGCSSENFLMVGNSLKSDILPVLELGGYAVHIPFHVTWTHEKSNTTINNTHFTKIASIVELLTFLD